MEHRAEWMGKRKLSQDARRYQETVSLENKCALSGRWPYIRRSLPKTSDFSRIPGKTSGLSKSISQKRKTRVSGMWLPSQSFGWYYPGGACPQSGKQFTNFFYFMKNASKVQQSELWKVVAREARKMLKKNENVWISSHD